MTPDGDVEMNGKQNVGEGAEKAEPETGDRRRLVHVNHETLEHKDFRAEVRGLRDISTLLDKCSVMLDVTVSDFSFILEDELIRAFSGSK